MFDESGAEKLYGQGDMLFRNSSGEMSRLQGAYMSNEEIGAVVDFVKEHNTPVYDERLKDFLDAEEKKAEMVANDMMVKKVDENTFGQGNQLSIEDDIIKEALKIGLSSNGLSTSLLQRKLNLGYPKAGKVIDALESMGLIEKYNGTSKPRKMLLTAEQYREFFDEEIDG